MALTLKLLGINQLTSTDGGASQAMLDSAYSTMVAKSLLVANVVLVNSGGNNALVDIKVQKAGGTARYALKGYDMASNSQYVLTPELTLYLNTSTPDSITLVAKSKTTGNATTIDYIVNGLERDV